MSALPLRHFPCFVWRLTPLSMGGLSDFVSRTVRTRIGPSVRRCWTVHDARVREFCSAARLSLPPVSSDLLVFLFGAFQAISSCDIFDVRGSPMTMFLPLPLSATLGRTKTFLLVGSIVFTGNGCVYLHLMTSQPTLIYGRLYLSTKNITIIGGMGKRIMPLTISTSL
jgi:hypothetical protein